jgi:preprotein translocase subunit SecY
MVKGVGFTGPDALPTLAAVISMTAGTMFLVWIGELITENGIGNGISLIIFGGIVAGLPTMLPNIADSSVGLFGIAGLGLIGVGILASIVFIRGAAAHSAVRAERLPARAGCTGSQAEPCPLRVNSAA